MLENYELEWEVLGKTEINNFKHSIKTMFLREFENNSLCVGHYSREIMESSHCLLPQDFSEKLQKGRCGAFEHVIFTNASICKELLCEDYKLLSVAGITKQSSIFILPFISEKEAVKVYWGSGFDNMEVSENEDVFARWYTGEKNQGRITIYNNSPYIKNVIVKGRMICLDNDALIKVSFVEQVEKEYSMKSQENYFEEEVRLTPGCNFIDFHYYGAPIQLNQGRHLKFCVENMILCKGEDMLSEGFQQYTETDRNGYIKDHIPDDVMRQTLHRNGFYDVTSFIVTENGHLIEGRTTTFAEVWSEYYVKKDLAEEAKGVLIMYVAKRKAEYYGN